VTSVATSVHVRPYQVDDADDVRTYLGVAKFTSEVAERTDEPGVATGLAWTSVGGEILFIEATRMHGTGKADVSMKEGGYQVEYEDEARRVHETFEAELAKSGTTCLMKNFIPWCTGQVGPTRRLHRGRRSNASNREQIDGDPGAS
jgi:hypothetical protein